MKKRTLFIFLLLTMLILTISHAEREWKIDNNNFTSNMFCFTIPSAINHIRSEKDNSLILDTNNENMIVAIIPYETEGTTIDQIDQALDINNSNFVAEFWNFDPNVCTSKPIAKTINSTEYIDYYQYEFEVKFTDAIYTSYLCIMNIRETSSFCIVSCLINHSIVNFGNLQYTKLVDSVYIRDPDEPFSTLAPILTPTQTPMPTLSPTQEPTPVPTPDYDRSIEITCDKKILRIGDKVKLKATVTKLKDSAPDETELEWDISVKSIGEISQDGTLTCLKPMRTTVICRAKDNPDIVGKLIVDIKRTPITKIQPQKSSLVITGNYNMADNIRVFPDDADSSALIYSSSDTSVVSVSGSRIAVKGPGDCNITISSTDGSNKSAKVRIHVPPFYVDQTEYRVTQKKGITIPVHWITTDSLTLNSQNSSFSANWNKSSNIFIDPIKPGSGTITIQSKKNPKDSVKIKIKIDNKAVYNNSEYPAISYTSAARYPDKWKNSKVQFQGTVVQVVNQNTFRISSDGRYGNIVYVTIPDSKIVIPIIDSDKVIVYGKLDGNQTYTSTLGAMVTIPKVVAEKITVK